ncbi:MAG: TonB-dependent receptor [Chitinophagaceae bacterium]|nr:TonB-dependent receptor [Chitinophagaceae bacterium]
MKKYLMIMVMIANAFITSGQETNFTGKVKDEQGKPLSGATLSIKGSQVKTQTNTDGLFSIKATIGNILVVSFSGFSNQSYTLKDSNPIDIQLNISNNDLNEVVVLGTRSTGRTKLESVSPVDVFDLKTLTSEVPQTNLTDILNHVAPSFNSTTQTVADGTDHVDPATVRGLGPDQTLVLINGKRRYTSALVNVNGTMGRGSVGTDLNAIAAGSIDKIELLRDGAAAQYGSDAIAGVINIQLNKNIGTGKAVFSSGANITTYQSYKHAAPGSFKLGEGSANDPKYYNNSVMDGQKTNASVNYGWQIGKTKASFINVTLNLEQREPTIRSGERAGDIDNRKSGDSASTALMTRLGVDRNTFQMRVGQSRTKNLQGVINGGLALKNGGEFYFFSILSNRVGNSTGFYRMPYQSSNIPAIYPNGFLPEITSNINDISLGTGLKGKMGTWNYDLSNTYGQNSFGFNIENTLNVSAYYNNQSKQSEFDAGTLLFKQNTTNIDFSKKLNNSVNLNMAYGAELRYENYQQKAGEEASWANYMRKTAGVTDVLRGTPTSVKLADNSTGIPAGGAQVFPGFRPDNSKNENRTSTALYVDFEMEPINKLLLDFAARYENYSDFGGNLSGKIAGRYKLADNFALRGSLSTGFRAPSLQQRFLTKTSTVFQGGVAFDDATLPNDSKAAQALGIPSLRPEISNSASIGTTLKINKFSLTVDAYSTKITDRIILTDAFTGSATGDDVSKFLYTTLLANNASRGIFMANATDLRTSGIDIISAYNLQMPKKQSLKFELATTLSKREILGKTKVSEKLLGRESTYMSPINKATLVDGNPKVKGYFSLSYKKDKLNLFLRNTYFGEVTHIEGGGTTNWFYVQVLSPKIVTDLSIGYKLSKSWRFSTGANNLFDIYSDLLVASKGLYKRLDVVPASPTYDKFIESQTAFQRGIVNNNGISSNNQFNYSRRVTQLGMNGRYLYARIEITF